MKRAAASTSFSLAEAESRLAVATSDVNSASATVRTLQTYKVDNSDPRYSLTMTLANAAQAAEDAALRWAAAADVARDPALVQLDVAVGSAASLLSQAATTALSAAVAAAQVRVELARRLCVTSHKNPLILREAKHVLFTAEYRLAMTNPSAAAAESRLAEAKAAHFSAQQSKGSVNRAGREADDSARTLASAWVKATEEAVAAAEYWVAVAEAVEAQASQRLTKRKR